MFAIRIYKITNSINSKVYIGFTMRSLKDRFTSHKYYAKRKPHYPLYAAMHEYGFDKFSIEFIEELPAHSNVTYQREQHWIDYYNSAIPCGYNADATSLKRLRTR